MCLKLQEQCSCINNIRVLTAIVTFMKKSVLIERFLQIINCKFLASFAIFSFINIFSGLFFRYYLKNLQQSDKNSIRVFRIMSLWLENRTNTTCADLMNQNLKNIPSYKFIPILPQLVPHLSSNLEDAFTKQIFEITSKRNNFENQNLLKVNPFQNVALLTILTIRCQ